MANGVTNIAIVKETLKKGGVVVLPLRTYEKLKERLFLFEEEARALQIIAEGEKEYKAGKLKPIKSLGELT